MIDAFNSIAVLANVPPITPSRVIEVEHDDSQYDITVWLKRATKPYEFAGTNEDGFRWVVVHNGMKKSHNPKPF